jgi:membrane protease YdiL (CAAX protease family)
LNGHSSSGAPAKLATTTPLAIACMVVWFAAAASTGLLGIWLAIGGAAVGLGGAVFVLDHAAARQSLQPSTRLAVVGVGAGCLMAAATYLLYPALARLSPFIAIEATRLYASFRALPPVIASLALLPVIVGEELVWRGVVQTELVRRLGRWRGVTLAALVYALAHAPLRSPLLLAVALLCGMTWGALRAVSGSLVPSLLAHLVWDLVVLLWLPLDLR